MPHREADSAKAKAMIGIHLPAGWIHFPACEATNCLGINHWLLAA